MKTHRAFLAVFLTVASVPAYPWGSTGHHVVALIAQQRLTPAARDAIDRLLFDGRYTIRDIAVCADQIRAGATLPGSRAYPVDPACPSVAGSVTVNTGPWHYIDIPNPTKEKDLEKFCPQGNCAVTQIERFTTILRDSNDDAARRQALLFLVHFMGDIHQPLHAIERGCDQGGNREHVNFYLGKDERANENLHRVWDTDLLDKFMKDSEISNEQELALELARRIDDGEARQWAASSIGQIAWESYKVAKKRVYRGIPFQDFCDKSTRPAEATDLSTGYESAGARTVRDQLMKAGVRLAALLNNALRSQAATAAVRGFARPLRKSSSSLVHDPMAR